MGPAVAVLLVVSMVGAFVIAGVTYALRRRNERSEPVLVAPAPPSESQRLDETLRALHRAARWTELLRLLDQTLPEWPVAASLIEAARGIAALEEDLNRTRRTGATEEVTSRLAVQTGIAAAGLWPLADRIAAADRLGSARLREELARQDAALVQLLGAVREAREELVELSLNDFTGQDDLRRAEGRFRALAAAARELNAWERERASL